VSIVIVIDEWPSRSVNSVQPRKPSSNGVHTGHKPVTQ
jgi:hypothetical protein